MKSSIDCHTRRELLLIELRARRLLNARLFTGERDTVLAITHSPDYPRSAALRFIFRHPHLCLWGIAEVLPLLTGRRTGRKTGDSLKRFTRACYADLYPLAIKL